MAVLARTATRAQPPHRGLLYAAIVIAAAAAIGLSLLFVWPRLHRAQTRFDLGPVDDYAVGQPITVSEGKFHLVRLSDNEFVALSWRDPQSGCTVPWRPKFEFGGETGWFRDPCHGSTFGVDGTREFGPSSRSMDRYPVSIINGEVVVNTDTYVCGYAPPGAECAPRASPP